MNTRREIRRSETGIARALVIAEDLVSRSVVSDALAGARVRLELECRASSMVVEIERAPAFDVVVVDQAGRGIEALYGLSYLRRRMAQTPILFLAESDAGLMVAAARASGATHCLTKPLTPAAVRAHGCR